MIDDDLGLPLPEGARVLHIGPMKTGTTSLQRSASLRRQELLEHGVLYPGKTGNHRRAIGALMGARVIREKRRDSVGSDARKNGPDPAVPDVGEWYSLLSQIASTEWKRVLVSHEIAAEADEVTARRLVDELGEATHVVVTLRNLTSVLPSMWTQRLKAANTDEFDTWLERAIGEAPERPLPTGIQRQLDHAGLVERWVSVLGRENVTVVIVDSGNPDFVGSAFEKLLDIPSGFLSAKNLDGLRSNRSLRSAEAEILRRINCVSVENSISWDKYLKLVQRGVVRRWLTMREPGQDEPRVRLPHWALSRSQELGIEYSERIRCTGVRIIGDLNTLHSVDLSVASDNQVDDHVPTDVVTEGLSGLLSAALSRGAFFEKQRLNSNDERQASGDGNVRSSHSKGIMNATQLASTYSTRSIISALRMRIAVKLGMIRSNALNLLKSLAASVRRG